MLIFNIFHVIFSFLSLLHEHYTYFLFLKWRIIYFSLKNFRSFFLATGPNVQTLKYSTLFNLLRDYVQWSASVNKKSLNDVDLLNWPQLPQKIVVMTLKFDHFLESFRNAISAEKYIYCQKTWDALPAKILHLETRYHFSCLIFWSWWILTNLLV